MKSAPTKWYYDAKLMIRAVTLLLILVVLGTAPASVGAQSSSGSYKIDESSFSSGSNIESSSASYTGRTSAGNLGVGNAESVTYQSYAGYITPEEEYVELVVPLSVIDMGIIEPGTPGTGTATFTARAYLNDVYVIVSPRDSPTLEGGTEMIDPITTAAAFDANAEQFGMNLVANTSPVVQGANPALQPNSTFAYGEAATGYDTADLYQYNQGDIIAQSVDRGYGETQYTISYIMNVTAVTPAGRYVMEQDLVILASF